MLIKLIHFVANIHIPSTEPKMISVITNNVPRKLLDWIPIDELNWKYMSSNPNAIQLLEKNLDKVSWYSLSSNPNAIHILEENLDKVDWFNLSSNPNAIPILEKNLDKVDWFNLSGNPNAIPILEKKLDKVTTSCWKALSANPNAIPILEKNLDKVDWGELSANPNAIHIIEQNLEYMEMYWCLYGADLSGNPNIFTIDYKAMKTNMYKECGIAAELMQNRFHPRNIHKFTNWGFPGIDDDDDV
jgi:hypothetical protein